jgi:hypothetical protein
LAAFSRRKKKPPPAEALPTLEDIIRDRIAEKGLTSYAVAKLAGVNPFQIERFMRGERGLFWCTY